MRRAVVDKRGAAFCTDVARIACSLLRVCSVALCHTCNGNIAARATAANYAVPAAYTSVAYALPSTYLLRVTRLLPRNIFMHWRRRRAQPSIASDAAPARLWQPAGGKRGDSTTYHRNAVATVCRAAGRARRVTVPIAPPPLQPFPFLRARLPLPCAPCVSMGRGVDCFYLPGEPHRSALYAPFS